MKPALQHRVAVGERHALACAVTVLVPVSRVSAWLALVSSDLSSVHAPPLFPHSLRGLCATRGLSRALRVHGLRGWFLLFYFSFWSLSFVLGAFRTPLALLGCLLSKRHWGGGGGAHQLLSLLGACRWASLWGRPSPVPPLPTVVRLLLRVLEAASGGDAGSYCQGLTWYLLFLLLSPGSLAWGLPKSAPSGGCWLSKGVEEHCSWPQLLTPSPVRFLWALLLAWSWPGHVLGQASALCALLTPLCFLFWKNGLHLFHSLCLGSLYCLIQMCCCRRGSRSRRGECAFLAPA